MKKSIIAAVLVGTMLLSGCSGVSRENSSLSSISSTNGNTSGSQSTSSSSSTSAPQSSNSTLQESSSADNTASQPTREELLEQYKKEIFVPGAKKCDDWYYKERASGSIEAVLYVGDYSEIEDVDKFVGNFYTGLYNIIVEAPNHAMYTYYVIKENGDCVAVTALVAGVTISVVWKDDYAPLNDNENAKLFNAIWSGEDLETSTSQPSSSSQAESQTPPTQTETATTGERNALKKAQSYLDFSAFSRDGLIGQLEFEGFTNSEAIYGADNVGADWNEQAVKKAKSYLDFTAFSYSGLIEQLEFEEFTHEQAVYGADKCGADWNEQAAKKAKSYLDFIAFSREGLIEQLEFEGFTHDQAVYGAAQNGY